MNSFFITRASELLRVPLEIVVNKEASCVARVVASIAIGILSLLSLGLYAYKTYKFLDNHRASLLEDELEQAISSKNLPQFQKVLSQHTWRNIEKDYNGGTLLSKLVSAAAAYGQLEMMKLLHQKGAELDHEWACNKPLHYALVCQKKKNVPKEEHLKVVNYLLKNGVKVEARQLYEYFSLHHCDVDVALILVEKCENASSKGYDSSFLNRAAGHLFLQDKIKGEQLLLLLVQKGDRFLEDERPSNDEALAIINAAIETAA